MANVMSGQLKVANDIGPQAAVDTRVSQLPSSGIEKLGNQAASVFAGIGERIGQMADKAAATEGEDAGRIAGLDPEFRTQHNNTIRGDAFDRAGLNVAETRLRQQIDAGFDGAFQTHANDPAALNKALDTQRMGVLQHAPDELRPGLELLMRGKRLAFSREQARRQMAEAASAAAGALETQTAETLKGIHQRAYSLGLDPEADSVLASDVASLARTLDRRGPDGKRLVTPESAAKRLEGVRETVATARLSGAFQRLPTLEAKAKFIQELDADFRQSKGLASVYDLNGFERVKSGLEADYRAAKSEHDAGVRAVKEDVTSVSKMAEKGFSPAPDDLAALKARVTATGDEKTGAEMALAENTIAWQNAARRATPSELEAVNDSLREKLRTGGATPAEVARLELGDKLAATMRTELKQDPLGWADRVGVLKVAPLNFSDPATAQGSIKARLAQAEQVAALYDQKPTYLRPAEKQALATALAKGGQQALAVATMVASTAGDRAPKIMGELADHAPVMAGLGGLVAQSGGMPPQVAIDAFDALAARQDVTEKGGKGLPAVAMPKPADVQMTLANVAGGALSRDPRNEAAVINAATLAYEIRAARAHAQSFDQGIFEQAVSEVLGERTIGGVKYGGVARQPAGWWSPTNDVVLPPNVRQDGWRDAIEALSPAVLDQAGIGQPVSESGSAISFDRIKGGTLVQVGNGRYLVSLGDPSTPGQEQFVRENTTGTPQPLVLDFDRLSPILARKRPDLFLGGGQ